MTSKNSDYYFLNGGGKMGKLMREKDWSKTSLGDPADWPECLRTMVAVMLENPFGMYIAWGKEYLQLYNDGYRPILGASKHPNALGISTRVTFSEIWHIIESMFDGVMQGHAVGFPDLMLPLNRNGFVEECFFDFAYSPIRKDNGEVGGVLVTVIETTDKKKTEKSLKESNARFRNTMKQAPVGITILRGPDYIVEMANDSYLQIVDKVEADFVGKPLFKSLPEIEEAVHSLLDSVLLTGMPYHGNEMPIPVNRHGKEEIFFFDFIWHPLRDEDGKISGVIAVVSEVTEKVKARKIVEDSEKRYNLMLMQSPFAFLILKGKEMVVYLANASMKDVLGKGNGIEGKPLLEILPEIKGQAFPDLLEQVYQTGNPFSATEMLAKLNRNGRIEDVYFNYVYQPYHEADGVIAGVTVIAYDVTTAVIAKRKIEESEQRFRLALAGSNQIVFSQDKNLIHTWIYNPHPDFKQEEIIGKTDQDLHVPETAVLLTSIKRKVLNTGKAFNGDVELEVAGKKSNYTLHIEAIKDSDENVTGIIGTSIDITERVKIEHRIRESEEQFSTLADNMENLAWLADGEGSIYWYNKRWLQYTGLTLEEMQGWGWQKVHHPEHVERIDQIVKDRWHINESFELTFPLRRHDGVYRWFLTRGYPFTNQEGKIIRWIGTNTDITEHKEAEEQFRLMAERMPQKVWTADEHGNRNYFNQIMLNYTGLSFEELKDWGWKKIIHPDDWLHTKEVWEQCINSGEDFENETRLLRKDGQYLWHLVRATAVKDESGRPKIWIGSKTEIQEQIELSEILGENLKRSNERMQTILQHAPDAVISIDEDGVIRSWNAEAEVIFGWKEHEVLEKTLTETIIPERYREGHMQGMQHYLRTGEGPVINKPIELAALRKNGSEFPVELKISTSKINDGYIFIGFIRDISVRKQAEETIQNKTNQLIEAQQLAHMGSWEWDVRSNKINWSDELYRIYGLKPKEFEADYENFMKYVYPDDREFVNSIILQAFKDHQPYSFFHKAERADGEVRILSATGKVFTDEAGNVVRMSGTAQDVTSQKKYEQELQISEERFYKIFDSNPVPMSLSEVKTNKIIYANILFFDAFGYSKDEVIGNSSEQLNLMDAGEYKRVIDLIFGYLDENRTLEEVQALSKEETESFLLKLKQSEKMKDFEVRYTRKNGETFPAIVSFELIKIGTESYKVTSYQDITERKKSETMLKNQNDQLEKMNKELESFAYVSSHDLQEPLRKIQTLASRIKEKEVGNLSDYGKELFNRVQNSAKRMQTLIQDLLSYSSTNTAERKFIVKDLHEIIAEVKEDLKEELQEKNGTIEANQLCDAYIIPFQFRQLLHNLIGNSLKFSHPDHPPIIQINSEIATGLKLKNEKLLPSNLYCHITVSDNGIGFEEQYNEKIFEVFQRLHNSQEYNGTGIGLSIVKKIVENHQGIITANGLINKGATFDIYIPAI